MSASIRAAAKITRARTALVMNQPFFGTLALGLRPVEDAEKTQTIATDGRSLFYAAAYIDQLPDVQLRCALAHEVMHCAALHMTRRKDRKADKWNEACDYAINPDLQRAGFVLPPEAKFNPDYDGLGAEEIYAALIQEDQENPPPPPAGGGSGAPDHGMGGIIDAPADDPDTAAEIENDWRATTATAAAVAKAQNAGNLPAFLQRLLGEQQAARIDWREALRRFVDDQNRTDYTWTRPNRRFIGSGFYLPGTQPDGIAHLCAIVDTSGSIQAADLEAFRAEIAAAIDEGAADRLTVIYTDTKVQGVQKFERGDEIKLQPKGGGGTDFRAVMRELDQIAPDASAILFLTDLCVSQYGDEPAAPVLWVSTSARPNPPPFGEIVRLA